METLLRPFVMKHQEFGKRVLYIGALSHTLVFTIAVDFGFPYRALLALLDREEACDVKLPL